MPLIKNNQIIDNIWTYVPDDAPLGDESHIILGLERFLAERLQQRSSNKALGVRLAPADDPEKLRPYLDELDLIEVDFPKYADGRGFSQAQLLRRRYAYTGELRAVGEVLRDQILYMHRSGFDTFSTTRADLSDVMAALDEFSLSYQKAADIREAVFGIRQKR
ncbi:MAG: hypothetical protein CME93_01615 [Hyphomonadaceae bacterium]|nr:hypothetical protein [Hyphomonadaceae bacterium]OUX95801.1 MAG: hypothetical protein CBB77_01355 [Hyphomonas sp. TMED17]CAI8426544.1 MAG: Uncharacterised protein [Hyphomonas sp. TMED17]